MTKQTLQIKLNDSVVGYLTHHNDGKNIFIFDESYSSKQSPVLSLSFREFSSPVVTRHRLPNFFSNLLPEGGLRELVCTQLGVHSQDEFSMLAALGNDLPGAVIATSSEKHVGEVGVEPVGGDENMKSMLTFSLAGVQIKFSMLKEKSWFTLHKNNLPGDHIVKTPSVVYPFVPENEFSMMRLASVVGIDVPKVELVPLSALQQLPLLNLPNEQHAYAVARFDRGENNRVHIEDFAQVFDVKPEKKYEATNYDSVARFLLEYLPNGTEQFEKFFQRLAFNIAIGNTDAHLKNWSLFYKDGRTPELAPAYDLVSTLPYLNNRELALNLAGTKHFYSINDVVITRFAKKVGYDHKKVLQIYQETIVATKNAWQKSSNQLPIPKALNTAMHEHWQRLSS